MGANPKSRYGHDVGKYNQAYYQGWDPKLYCRQRPAECQEYMRCVTYYNPYYPTHIAAAIFLWITFISFIGSTYHAWTLHIEYKNFINGVETTTTSVMTKMGSKFTVGRFKRKPTQTNNTSQSAYVAKSNSKSGRISGSSQNPKSTSGRSKATSGKSSLKSKKVAESINTPVDV
jgi:hypothetical protein